MLGVARQQGQRAPSASGFGALLPHKAELEKHLRQKLGDLFGLDYDLRLYDVTSTSFEGQARANPLAQRGYARAKNLMRAGIDEVRAWRSATNGRGPWWKGGASHMNAACPKSWFDSMGLVSLLEAQQRLTSAS